MQGADQILLFTEALIYVILMLQVLFRRHIDEVEEYLVAYLGLSIVPALLWLMRLATETVYLPSVEIISSWTRVVPALAFGVLTMAFVRQTRWVVGWWLLGSIGLFAILVALQFGWLVQPPLVVTTARATLWALALGSATLAGRCRRTVTGNGLLGASGRPRAHLDGSRAGNVRDFAGASPRSRNFGPPDVTLPDAHGNAGPGLFWHSGKRADYQLADVHATRYAVADRRHCDGHGSFGARPVEPGGATPQSSLLWNPLR